MSGRRGTAWTVAGRRAVAVAGRRAVAVGVAVGLLAACAGSPEVEPSAPPTQAEATPSPTPTPTPTAAPETIPPERPAAMDEISTEGAEAVARYFLSLHMYAYRTGDLSDWRALSAPECAFCSSVADGVEAAIVSEQRAEGGEFTVNSTSTTVIDDGSRFSVELRGQQEPWAFFESDGTISEQSTVAVPHVFLVALRHDGAGWLVLGVQVDDPPA